MCGGKGDHVSSNKPLLHLRNTSKTAGVERKDDLILTETCASCWDTPCYNVVMSRRADLKFFSVGSVSKIHSLIVYFDQKLS